ncbi:MAG: ribose-phosphate diphosphokinase [Acholeplasmatales bacterium]|nr:ribose-phosphate diphosphokinase [Acholeplasmatales bacterium]
MYRILVLDESSLGKNVLKAFKKEDIVSYKYSHFKDGEMLVELNEPVRGDDIIVLASFSTPVNDNLMKLLICVDALRRASAKSVDLLVPYLGYARQDRRMSPWQPITARLVADLLQTSGATRVITFDLHAPQIEGFYSIPIDNIPVSSILGMIWRKTCPPNFNPDDDVVVSPDHGGVVRARAFMNSAGIPNLVVVNKYRERANEVSSMQVIGNVDGKNAIIVDDLVDTGGTLMRAATELKKLGAKEIYIFCTHGVLSDDAIEKLSNCEAITKLIITNTIDKSDQLINDRIEYIDLSRVVIGIIKTLQEGKHLVDYLKKLVEYDPSQDKELQKEIKKRKEV